KPDVELARLLRGELDRAAASAKLRPHEIPRDFVIERARFTAEAGLLAETGKPRRARLAAAFRDRLDALYANIEARQLRAIAGGTLRERIASAIALVLGL